MYCIKETYRVIPRKLDDFYSLFHDYLYPCQVKNGARLIGSWNIASTNNVIVIWEYPSYHDYLDIQDRVIRDDMYKEAKAKIQQIGEVYNHLHKETLTPTGLTSEAKQKVSVSGFITNSKGEVLLVKTYWRSDTWELPGGGVDEGETLDKAVRREILEETGVQVKLHGISGVYSNGTNVTIVFVGTYLKGTLQTSEETKDVQFIRLDTTNVPHFIKRKKFIPRVYDAMKQKNIPYESFSVRPYQLLNRIEGKINE